MVAQRCISKCYSVSSKLSAMLLLLFVSDAEGEKSRIEQKNATSDKSLWFFHFKIFFLKRNKFVSCEDSYWRLKVLTSLLLSLLPFLFLSLSLVLSSLARGEQTRPSERMNAAGGGGGAEALSLHYHLNWLRPFLPLNWAAVWSWSCFWFFFPSFFYLFDASLCHLASMSS